MSSGDTHPMLKTLSVAAKGVVNEVERTHNRTKSQARSRVEHVFVVMKSIFHFTKVRAP